MTPPLPMLSVPLLDTPTSLMLDSEPRREVFSGGDAVVRCGDVIVAGGCRCRCTGIVTVEDDPLSSQRIIKLGVERDLVAADATGCQV